MRYAPLHLTSLKTDVSKIDKGESPEKVLAREVEEELCVSIRVGEGLPVSDYGYEFPKISLFPFKIKIIHGKIYLNEHPEYRWVDKSDLLDLKLAPADIPVARFYASV